MPYLITASKPGFAAIVRRSTSSEAMELVRRRHAEGYVQIEITHRGTTLSEAELADLASREALQGVPRLNE